MRDDLTLSRAPAQDVLRERCMTEATAVCDVTSAASRTKSC